MSGASRAAARIHLDLVGGISGDMFLAAICDAYPELETPLIDGLRRMSVSATFEKAASNGIGGKRLRLSPDAPEHHHSRPYSKIADILREAPFAEAVRKRALEMLRLIGEAEAAIHGESLEKVALHELGSRDSICDLAGAAFLIEELQAKEWTVGLLPLGSGTVMTAHGALPVPAPATASLLKGFRFIDDGVPGERITPTGAAILRSINARQESSAAAAPLARIGYGAGTRTLPKLANVLRVLCFEETAPALSASAVAVIEFEIDDQSAEDLAIGLDHIRRIPGVLDLLQAPAFGKKGRLITQVRILAEPDSAQAVSAACFEETATLGIRKQLVEREILSRRVIAGPDAVVIKESLGPAGDKRLKVEADSLKEIEKRVARERLRRKAESGTE